MAELVRTKPFEQHFTTWKAWCNYLEAGYLTYPQGSRDRLLFRGQSNSDWVAQPVIDRDQDFENDESRDAYAEGLRTDFRNRVRFLYRERLDDSFFDENEIDGLARHHGVPTTLLDWTRSPYIAAHFAFYGLLGTKRDKWPESVAVYRYTPSRLLAASKDQIEVVECDGRANSRAWAQRSCYIRVKTVNAGLESLIPNALSKYTIASSAAEKALAHLDAMGISGSALFPDHEGAARAVIARHYRWSIK